MAPETINSALVFKTFWGGAPELRLFTKIVEFHEICYFFICRLSLHVFHENKLSDRNFSIFRISAAINSEARKVLRISREVVIGSQRKNSFQKFSSQSKVTTLYVSTGFFQWFLINSHSWNTCKHLLITKPRGYIQAKNLDEIEKKSSILHIGCNLNNKPILFDNKKNTPVLLWNHRWEYDKNPELFFNTLFKLKNKKIDFRLIVLGEKYKEYPEIFDLAQKKLKNENVQQKNKCIFCHGF